jgi:hypothetical protein
VSRPRILPAGFIEPCIPTVARVPPSGPGWLQEIKHGYRLVGRLQGRQFRKLAGEPIWLVSSAIRARRGTSAQRFELVLGRGTIIIRLILMLVTLFHLDSELQ